MGSALKAVGLKKDTAGQAEAEAAQRTMQEALKRMESVDLPDYEKMQLALEEAELVGKYDPEALQNSAYEDIVTDPSISEAQRSVLEEMQDLGTTGLGAEDMAAYRDLSRGVGAQEQARQESILQQMAQRGTMDSGAQLAAQLSSSQSSANQAAAQADRIAQASAEARRSALGQSANLASGMRQSEFGEKAQVASAKDLINKFNVQTRNQAEIHNLGEQQRIAEKGVDTRTQEQMFNKQLEQQKFNDSMQKTGATTGMMAQNAAQQQAMGAGKAQASAAKQAAVLGAAGAIGGGFAAKSDRNLKKNIQEPSSDNIIGKLEDMLSELKAYKYEYKDEEYMPGEQMGVMAQDLEKSELGERFVEDTPEGKTVNYGEMTPTIVAGLADLHERVKKIEEV